MATFATAEAAAPQASPKISTRQDAPERGADHEALPPTRGRPEPRFAHDFSSIRLASQESVLRELPGGRATRPFPRLPSSGLHRVAPMQSHSESIPAEVRTTVGALGHALLRAALGSKQRPPSANGGGRSELGAGMPLSSSARAPFERSFGYDLSSVRVHTGPSASGAARAVDAAAFALGDHIVLGGSVDTSTPMGRRILGHEIAHTIQSRFGRSVGRISDPTWPAEREAERASLAALAGERFEIEQAGGDDLHRVAPWVILAGIGLVAGLITWAASDSPEENQRQHADGTPDPTRDIWALVPVYGSIQQIRHAESYFQRVLGVGFLMLDLATLGSAGIAAKALLRVPGTLARTVFRRRGTSLLVAEGGEILTEAVARETAATFGREGGVLFASRQAAATEISQALTRGSFVVVTEGTLNHAAIYARNAAGQVVRIHGGPLRVLFEATPRALNPGTTSAIAQRVNAYAIVEAGQATVSIETAIANVQRGNSAILRWITGSPTSCGIVQGAVLEATGLPTATLARLVPEGGAAARLLPITVLDHIGGAGGLRLVEGGTGRIIGGTLLQSATLGGTLIPVSMSTLMRLAVVSNDVGEPLANTARTSSFPSRGLVGEIVARAVLSAWETMDPTNWDTSQVPARSRPHLAVLGFAVRLAGSPDRFLATVARTLSSFPVGSLLPEMAEDFNAALRARGGGAAFAATFTAEFLGRQNPVQLINLLSGLGLLRFVQSIESRVEQRLVTGG